MNFSFRIENKDKHEIVFFAGDINEDAELTLGQMHEKLGASCKFNLRGVKSINSCGVRAWINFIREAQKGRQIVFEECPPEVVGQINMIPNFRGNAQIRSVYASYSCENCDLQKLELFEEGRNLPKSLGEPLPTVACPKCGQAMEMEELEDEFFGWLESN